MRHLFLWLAIAVVAVSVDCNKIVNDFIYESAAEVTPVATEPAPANMARTQLRPDSVFEEACGRYAEVLQTCCPYSFHEAGGMQRLEHLCVTGQLDMSAAEDILSPDPFSNLSY